MLTRRVFALLLLALPVAAQQQRIISTAPSITELLYALGLEDRLVAVDRFSRYPAQAARKQQIGDYATPNLEMITSLKPTLVMIPTNPVRLRERLEAMQLKVLELDQETLPKMFQSFRQVGDATGSRVKADQLVASLRAKLDAVRAKVAGRKPTRMMFVVGRVPHRLEGLVVVGGGSHLNELIEIAGGDNVFKDAKTAYPKVSLEEVLARNPEVVIDMGDMADTVGVTDAQKKSVAQLWTKLGSLAAVRNKRVNVVASDVYMVPGPRVTEAAELFLAMLHPEVAK
jgi:iron complex transport system substrate-binding protein